MSVGNKKKYMAFGAAAIALFMLILSAGRALGRLKAEKADTEQGLKYLAQAEAADIYAVRHRIRALNESEGEALPGGNYKAIFEDLAIMGDSVPAALKSYGCLFSSSVAAQKGEPYKSQTEVLRRLAPEIIFISYGTDEIAAGGTDPDGFAERYAIVLDYVGEALPDSRIFVNSIFPAAEWVSGKMPEFSRLKEYNEKLREVCDKRNIGFIDNSGIDTEGFYERDGLHFKSAFYPHWLERMAKAAELP